MLYNGFSTELARRFQRKFEDMKVVHNLEWGDEFEIALAQVLQDVLPSRAGVCRGYVVGRNGQRAGDDIVIFDCARFPTLRSLGNNLAAMEQVPAEAVLAYIEAKHTLKASGTDGQSLSKAIKQVNAVKSIIRPAVPLSRIAPSVDLSGPLTVTNKPGLPDIWNPWYAAVFARNIDPSSDGRLELAKNALDLCATVEYMPDTIIAGNVVGLPVALQRDASGNIITPAQTKPFLCANNELIFMDTPDIAIGIGVLHLLWAIEKIVLGDIPWEEMIIESLVKDPSKPTSFSAGNPPIRSSRQK